MRVMVTGATGFVGFHTARALVAAGHEVRLLVRSLDKMANVFEPFGLAGLDAVRGDITDPRSVASALEGCDAVVHSAAMVSVHASDSDEVLRNNLRGTELVLGGAHERGIERMIQVSSTTALFRPGADRVDERSPLGDASSGYGHSKIACDRYVRKLQAAGARIYTTYPGSVLGPDDPGMSEAVSGLKYQVDGRFVADTTSGIQIIDARDLATAHVRLLERGGPPARYLMGGVFLSWSEFAALLEELTAATFACVPAPAPVVRLLGWLGDIVGRFVPIDLPLSLEATTYATEWVQSDDSLIKQVLDFEYRDVGETVGDTIRWLRDENLLLRDIELC